MLPEGMALEATTVKRHVLCVEVHKHCLRSVTLISQQAIQKGSAVSRMLHRFCAHFIVRCIGERTAGAVRNSWALCSSFFLHHHPAWSICCSTTDLCGATSALYSWANLASPWMQLPFLFRGQHCNHLCSYGQVNDCLMWTYSFLETNMAAISVTCR